MHCLFVNLLDFKIQIQTSKDYMSKEIRISKGLDIRLVGAAALSITDAIKSNFYTLRPDDFHGVTPKLAVKAGVKLKAGETVFFDKANEAIKFVTPVSGEILEITRGDKRRILEVKIKADKKISFKTHKTPTLITAQADEIKSLLLASGCWPFIKQRPYDVIAKPERQPKAIFISAHATAPLAVDYNFTLQGKEVELQAAVTALSKLTDGPVHVGVSKTLDSPFKDLQGICIHKLSGPHPSGNVGTLINKIDPINKGETVWTIAPQDLVIIGELLLTGIYNAERTIAMVGSQIEAPRYLKTRIGSEVATMIYDRGIQKDAHARIISGNVLCGMEVKPDGFLDFYSDVITVIPEGDDYEFFGWNKPVFNKVSTSRALTFS